MIQLSEDMMRAYRRHEASGRPATRDLANEEAARHVLARVGRQQGKPGVAAALRAFIARQVARRGLFLATRQPALPRQSS